MRMREYKLFWKDVIWTYFAVLQQIFVLNFVKKFTKVQHGFCSWFYNWK